MLVATVIFLTTPASASEQKAAAEYDASLQAIILRVDNDLFAGSDRGYSNGVEIGFLSQTVDDWQDTRLPTGYRSINHWTGWLRPQGYRDYNMSVTISHDIYTPGDWRRRDIIADDQPYAGVFLLGLQYNGRDADTMHSTSLYLGMVGPSARAAEIQRGVHKLVGSDRFHGWDNQLADEPVFRLHSEWFSRYSLVRTGHDRWQQDLVLHGGGSLGNLQTGANAGVEWRFGPTLPDNFGSAPLLQAATGPAPEPSHNFSPQWKMHGFVILDLAAVVQDITLDGNTWKDSHSVDRRPLRAGVGAGIAADYGKWRFAFARYLGTREFEGQLSPPEFGRLTVRRDF
ncbi:lipid A deacylase LpxR family protein [Microbulbifer hainanensis]|uniref:lipid A deacylase LpxR family protein n=1 Tax=Microbulbifer hainanensis TaxID=2735675 RepID=UPI0018694960|nr:lipid A deacylase LpxR family protein [Microbulbifer hainanensis]